MTQKLTPFDKEMSAVTFAEAAEFETATKFLDGKDVSSANKSSTVAVKKKPYGGQVVFGALSISGYAVLMANQGLVSDTFTSGGWHAAFPVVTALIFSFVHGAFASNLLSVLGIEAKSKK